MIPQPFCISTWKGTAMTTHAIFTARPHRPQPTLAAIAGRLMAFDSLWRQRRSLAKLDESRLADLGLDPVSAGTEAKKPIWNAPNHWSR
jgi:uncharacterized protein YjiS (DUF1127 family)